MLATSCSCGKGFEQDFERMVAELLPNDKLEQIPFDDVIWTHPYDVKAQAVKATEAYRKKYGDQWAPLYGVKRDGRWVIVFSPVDLCCGLEESVTGDMLAYHREDAFPVIANVFYYFVTP
ncbi:MAG: DUF4159 domain-containing protein [Verrucomicrobiota bacterium]